MNYDISGRISGISEEFKFESGSDPNFNMKFRVFETKTSPFGAYAFRLKVFTPSGIFDKSKNN